MILLAILQEESIWILAEIKHMVMYLQYSEIHIFLNMLKNMAANVQFFYVYKYLSIKYIETYTCQVYVFSLKREFIM